ncbi:universal stress protein [Sutcliffiella rhizosphaerae]|uniref:Stress response protein NhaX n=1 Tax=Sutcliffiella rhizosphaerae TaxID=2880967 RepID=A0ABN8ABY0_9BACI|nr:universal stress protein [Sutcliffiella rhizosphaerae]CAG9621716.1 Stress response protein NhaX [Sutcliffiella rhizosphaerae]
MNVFQNILIAYDGSESSLKAVRMGIDMKKKMGTNITIVHVLEETPVTVPIQSTRPDALPTGTMGNVDGLNIYTHSVKEQMPGQRHVADTQGDSTQEMLNEIHAILSNERLEAPVEVLQGDPAKSICNFANTHESDLIIIGSRGLGGLKKLILGSVSDKVTNTAECPVLIAK